MSFKRLKGLSAWRRLSLVTWKRPSDPTIYGQFEFDATNLLQVIDNINNNGKCDAKITMTHLVAKGLAMTMAKYPALNGIIRWGTIYLRDTIDIFLQVAVPDENNPLKDHLSGAKISRVDTKSLPEISRELSSRANLVRTGKDPLFQKTFNLARVIPLPILKILTKIHEFLVFNLGVHWPALGLVADPFGSAMVTSVGTLGLPPGFAPLVPPSRCPLLACVGAVQMKPWAIDSTTVAVRPVIGVAFTGDHRFIDGYMAARMFRHFRDFMENPEKYIK